MPPLVSVHKNGIGGELLMNKVFLSMKFVVACTA
jgi:hypothetical protein